MAMTSFLEVFLTSPLSPMTEAAFKVVPDVALAVEYVRGIKIELCELHGLPGRARARTIHTISHHRLPLNASCRNHQQVVDGNHQVLLMPPVHMLEYRAASYGYLN